MKMKTSIVGITVSIIAILFLGCDESLVTKNSAAELKQTGAYEGPGGYAEHSNGNEYPYPEIIHQVIMPSQPELWNLKTLAWRITWPSYADDADPEKIPTIWSGDGILHSIEYLNNVAPENTYNTLFSLYFDETIQRTATMADELDFVAGAPKKSMRVVSFTMPYSTPKGLQILVEHDAAFHMMWQVPYPVEELEYQVDDVLWYKIGTPDSYKWYGAIRIVSMEPRIVEVFLGVPINRNAVTDFKQ
jgi:hypothetical protein